MIFRDHAMKYFELGIPVIPLKGKVPLVRGWQEWSAREQTLEEVEALIERHPSANIGAVLGRWACAVDIDVDDPDVLRTLPHSPLMRRGAKGLVAFYRSSGIKNVPGREVPVELLNHGRQAVLPPSIHPDTGQPYQWLEGSDVSEPLTDNTVNQFVAIVRAAEKRGHKRGSRVQTYDGQELVNLADAGRNNRLTAIAYAMACEDMPEAEAVERLLTLDKQEHDVPWFSDPTEPHKGKRPEEIARRFYQRALKASESRCERLGPITININPTPPVLDTRSAELLTPKPRGLMRLFHDYCQTISVADQSALSLGGALALMSALASNRFYTRSGTYTVYPNLYVMNLANSGFGKETPQRAIDELLTGSGLLGAASYKSGSSIVMGLTEQPQRLDVIDECAMLLKAMGSREDYKADIVDVLSTLYTKSASYFHGFTSVANGKSFGACWNPCVNILGSTTPAGFRSSVNRDMAAKGLLPRFIVFYQRDAGEFKRDQDVAKADALLNEMRRMVRAILSTPLREHQDGVQENLLDKNAPIVRYQPELLPMSPGAQRRITDIQERYFNETKLDPESFEAAFKNRFAQHTAKLAMLDALGQGLAEIGVDSVEWAHEVVTWQWQTVKPLYELASAENDHEKDVLRVMQYIQNKGHVSRRDVTRKFQGIWSGKLDGILQQLVDSAMIEAGVPEGTDPSKRGRKATVYRVKSN